MRAGLTGPPFFCLAAVLCAPRRYWNPARSRNHWATGGPNCVERRPGRFTSTIRTILHPARVRLHALREAVSVSDLRPEGAAGGHRRGESDAAVVVQASCSGQTSAADALATGSGPFSRPRRSYRRRQGLRRVARSHADSARPRREQKAFGIRKWPEQPAASISATA